jgi:hypothetical protein
MRPLLLFSAGVSLGLGLGISAMSYGSHQQLNPALALALFILFIYGTLVGTAQLIRGGWHG